MIGLSRLKRAIADVPTGGMQTGTSRVQLKLCDAQRIEVEYGALIAERDVALAQNAELVAHTINLVDAMEDFTCDYGCSCGAPDCSKCGMTDAIHKAMNKTPNQCLRDIQAEAVLSAAKFFAPSRDIDVEALESYAARVKAGVV